MLGLSTSWKSESITDGNELLDELHKSGLSALEIDYRIWEHELLKIKKRLKKEFTILSVHNPCPIPSDRRHIKKPWRIAEFSALDHDERAHAVRKGIETLQLAADFEAQLVVFHFGQVDSDFSTQVFYDFFKANKLESEQAITFRNDLLNRRKANRQPNLDAVLKSIDALHNEAVKLGVLIGAENRLYAHQIPFDDEFEIIFNEFDGGNVRYWHDVGHAEVMHRLGLIDHEKDRLHRLAEHIGGMHIHDIDGVTDHLAPGNGSFDFTILTKYLKNDSIKIIEVHNESVEDLQKGIHILNDYGIS